MLYDATDPLEVDTYSFTGNIWKSKMAVRSCDQLPFDIQLLTYIMNTTSMQKNWEDLKCGFWYEDTWQFSQNAIWQPLQAME